MNPDISYEDKDIIVCTKPAGIPTQSSRIGEPDMVSILKNYLYTGKSKEQPPYLALIHRLDQPVEGLLVFAKTPKAAKELNRQLTGKGFGKYYRALLQGFPARPEDTLEDYIVKDARGNTSRICSCDTKGAKKALLHYKIAETTGAFSLAEITLETGRHHQIRVQMAHLGTPIAGDRKYSPMAKDSAFAEKFKTLQLFACRLEFGHPRTGMRMEFCLDRLSSIKNVCPGNL